MRKSKEKKITLEEQLALRAALTPKQAAFADHYLGSCFYNGTKAAGLAGYKGDANTLGSVSYKLLREPDVKAYIDSRLASIMPANEVLHRLARIASTSIDDVTAEGGAWLDLEKARSNGAIHSVKKIKVKRFIKETKTDIMELPSGANGSDESAVLEQHITREILSEEIEFEMYSQKDAVVDLGRYHKLFGDSHKLDAELNHNEVKFYIPQNNRDNKDEEES